MIVYFGMSGAYSATLFHALVSSGIRPGLVVMGVAPSEHSRSPVFRLESAKKQRGGWSPPSSSEDGPAPVALEEAAQRSGVDVLFTSDPGSLRVRAELHGRSPEALVVAGFPRLLPKEVLNMARRGGLNVHPGRLPEERGPCPVFWALREGKTRLGFSVHMLDEGEDSGDLVSSGEYAIQPGVEEKEVLRRCALAAAPHLIRAVRGLLAGDLVRIPQRAEPMSRCPRPTFRDGRVDPSKPAEVVYTFVAGCARARSLFVEIANDRFFIAEAVRADPRGGLPSEYVVQGDRMFLRTNPGVVELRLKEGGAIFSGEYEEE